MRVFANSDYTNELKIKGAYITLSMVYRLMEKPFQGIIGCFKEFSLYLKRDAIE